MRLHGGKAWAIRVAHSAAASSAAASSVAALCSGAFSVTLVEPADAAPLLPTNIINDDLAFAQMVMRAALPGAMISAVASPIYLVRTRDRTERETARLRLEVADLKS